MQYLFVTGLHRSGTTLLEKLLHNHPQVAMASQPAPFLYYHLKQAFLEQRGLQRLYPIDPQFPEADYHPADFTRFLQKHTLSAEEVQGIFRQMQGYESQYSPELLAFAGELRGGTFTEIYRQICDLTQHQAPEKQATWRGTKEILGEEFIPSLTQTGAKCLLVTRDPRDMLLSTNSGKELGQVRPTLYYLRLWRKSVAYALALQQNPAVLTIRYEDLVLNPKTTLARATGFLGISGFEEETLRSPLQSQQGAEWNGNSAFDSLTGLSTKPVGRFQEQLPAEAIALTEALCFPEMQLLGYPCKSVKKDSYCPERLQTLREVFPVTHPKFDPEFTHLPLQTGQEMHRASLLLQPEPAPETEATQFFLFRNVYRALRAALHQPKQPLSETAFK